jgi:hypothetical protein
MTYRDHFLTGVVVAGAVAGAAANVAMLLRAAPPVPAPPRRHPRRRKLTSADGGLIVELGILTLGDLQRDPTTGRAHRPVDRTSDILGYAALADQLGLDVCRIAAIMSNRGLPTYPSSSGARAVSDDGDYHATYPVA